MFTYQLFEIFFWVSVSIVSHTYIVYPILVRVLAIGKKPNDIVFSSHELPNVSIIMAAHNEENVIYEKNHLIYGLP
jgi:cellulose synthase/poly-beta-1,6-N-acetylglucosamine synthase-like glycosyltransferase